MAICGSTAAGVPSTRTNGPRAISFVMSVPEKSEMVKFELRCREKGIRHTTDFAAADTSLGTSFPCCKLAPPSKLYAKLMMVFEAPPEKVMVRLVPVAMTVRPLESLVTPAWVGMDAESLGSGSLQDVDLGLAHAENCWAQVLVSSHHMHAAEVQPPQVAKAVHTSRQSPSSKLHSPAVAL